MAIKYELKINIFDENYIERTDEVGVISFIPTDPANSDYAAYLASLEAPQA
jgi:hypothetical protein